MIIKAYDLRLNIDTLQPRVRLRTQAQEKSHPARTCCYSDNENIGLGVLTSQP